MNEPVSVVLTKQEVEDAISALLFSSSVNVVSNTNKEYQSQLFKLAKKLKYSVWNNEDLKLTNVQFLKEKNYEDKLSKKVYNEFGSNFGEIVKFENV